MPKVLIADNLSPRAVAIFKERGLECDVKTGLKPEELKAIIGQYDGLAVRSATKVTKDVLEAAQTLGVEKVDLDHLLARADFISLHTPLTDATRNIIDAKALAKAKKGVRIINCARGGLVVEDDLKAALDAGQVAGAALDVFL